MIPGLQYEEGQGLDQYSWCGYRWDQDGTAYELRYGPESDYHWWEIDDLIWGAFEESYLSAVDRGTHCVLDRDSIVEFYKDSSYVYSLGLCRNTIEYWWGPISPSDEVKYGLTTSELIEETDHAKELFSFLEDR